MTTKIIGPFEEYRVSHNGFRVPYITIHPHADGTYNVIVDNRFGIHLPVSKDELNNWMPILVNAMAVAGGYSSFGEHSSVPNRFKVGMEKLDAPPPKLDVIDGGKNDEPRE